jgi:RimJ/RimL family protein N-acetyltransferase
MSYFEQESERLLYRALTEDDIEEWSVFFRNNDRSKFLGLTQMKEPEDMARDMIVRQLNRYKEFGLGMLAAINISTGKLIGIAGIIPREINGKREYEIGYSLIPTRWGMGYGTEMAKQMRAYGEEEGIAKRFISIIDIRNNPSMNVARKNGMDILFQTNYENSDVYIFGYEPSETN